MPLFRSEAQRVPIDCLTKWFRRNSVKSRLRQVRGLGQRFGSEVSDEVYLHFEQRGQHHAEVSRCTFYTRCQVQSLSTSFFLVVQAEPG